MSVILIIALLLTGTYAWQSIRQKATNETRKEVETGGRLHDDFDGENKDVYVENYSSKETGTPIFVRVRLSEYLESGIDAGINRSDPSRDATSLDPNATIDNKASWSIHVPNSTNLAQCTGAYPFHDYWTWQLGGSTVYMPTFNKNNESLDADINGTWDYVDSSGNNVPYGDYQTYAVGDSVTADAQYSKNSSVGTLDPTGTYKVANETHTAKETQTATVMTMQQWLASGAVPGKYWIWDEDGWAYWGEALQPEEATGCLLTGIQATSNASENTYYAIDVVGEFASAYEWGTPADTQAGTSATGFYENGLTTDGKYLLDRIAGVVSDDNANQYVSCGHNTYKQILSNGTLGSLICAGEDQKIGTSDDKTNVVELDSDLEIDGVNYGSIFIGPGSNNTYWAMGNDNLLGTGDDVKIWYVGTGIFPGNPIQDSNFSFEGADEIVLNGLADVVETEADTSISNITTTVKLNNTAISNQNVSWTISGNTSSATTFDSTTNTLKIGADEQVGTLTITIKSDEDPQNAVKTVTVRVVGPDAVSITSGGAEVTTQLEMTKVESSKTFAATASRNGQPYSVGQVTWSMTGNQSTSTTLVDGVLTVAVDESIGSVLKITATSVYDATKSKTVEVKVVSVFDGITVGSADTVTIDGYPFYVLAKNGDETLIWSRNFVSNSIFGTTNVWDENCTAYLTLQNWLNGTDKLKASVVPKTIKTKVVYNNSTNYNTMNNCSVFLLTEADVFGSVNGSETPISSDYTYGSQLVNLDEVRRGNTYVTSPQLYISFLRSPANDISLLAIAAIEDRVERVSANPSQDYNNGSWVGTLRPALWVKGL